MTLNLFSRRSVQFASGFVAILLLTLSIQAWSQDLPVARETWGNDTSVAAVGRFYIAGQPDLEALQQAKENGVSIVINLRMSSEFDWDEAGAAASAALDYHQVPVRGGRPELDASAMQAITDIVEASPDAQVMVHCASGNRAAAWLAVYLAENQGVSADEAVAVANRAGLTREGMENKVRAYLENQP
ncbi:MAG: sulfur transferase domain-containing protein [Xanthomonadales bacterium]|nr:sulfur transferase domain-containing protein [Xanthomonadales bacterium]